MSRAQCIVIRENKLLMVQHRRNGEEWWCLPGGSVEPGETPEAGALRELAEECLVKGRLIKLTSMVEYAPNEYHYTYLIEIDEQIPRLGDDPDKAAGQKVLADIGWFSLDELAERDRAYLWTAGLLTIKQFSDDLLTWDQAPTDPRKAKSR